MPSSESKSSGIALWLGVGAVFGLLALAWTAMFFFANKHRAAEVPLETVHPAR